MDILNWLYIKKQQLIRTTLDSPQDLVVLGADASFQKRGDKYQSYAMPAEDFLFLARPYKVYTALMSQLGTSAPTATILENTLGNITWVRINAGVYRGLLGGTFLVDKLFIPCPSGGFDSAVNISGGGLSYKLVRLNDAFIELTTSATDSVLNYTPIEIRVYN
jgi:hypothetical protein